MLLSRVRGRIPASANDFTAFWLGNNDVGGRRCDEMSILSPF